MGSNDRITPSIMPGITRSSSPREQQPRLRETARQAEELMIAVTNPHHERPKVAHS